MAGEQGLRIKKKLFHIFIRVKREARNREFRKENFSTRYACSKKLFSFWIPNQVGNDKRRNGKLPLCRFLRFKNLRF